jgi:SAM-dependent methyltransferase
MDNDWEKHYQEEDMPWDKGEGAPPLLEWLARNEGRIAGGVLVPGCGLGHDVRVLAAQVTGNVVGLDLSPTAVKLAEAQPSIGGEKYVASDFIEHPAGWNDHFDWIWEHTCFCAIEPELRDRYVDTVRNLLKPGGQLLGVFYLNPYDEEHEPGDGPPYGSSEEELRERFVGTGGLEWVEGYVPALAYPGRAGRELMVRLRKP